MVFSYRTTALNRCCVAILSGFLFTQRIAEAKTDGRHTNLVLDYKAISTLACEIPQKLNRNYFN